eukprot:TRINITY_DN12146_c0_g1_i1.p1 TRINITY_DN12146_c0_g1~~TRINITY_DN12146_c0_g1_i1.p1  ORF type:complete len:644 (+),score=256.21 TRINITY_DN12146_c0_g1_i1:774-2705(+)
MQTPSGSVGQRPNNWEETRLEDEDFMTEWPQWRHEHGYGKVLMVVLVVGFFLGPLLAPLIVCCVILNQALKAYRTGFDLFVMVVVLYLLMAMAMVLLNSIYVYLAAHNQDEIYNTPTDRYGPVTLYIILYLWLAWVLARHFRTLATDGYNSFPDKLKKLQNIQFSPPLIAPRDEEPVKDVPGLIRKLCLYSDIFIMFRNDGSTYEDTASEPNDTCDQSLAWTSVSSMQSELTASSFHNTNWALPILLGMLIATAQTVIVRLVFSDPSVAYTPETKYSVYVYWLSTLFWWLVSALFSSIILALFTLYYRQLRSLMLFSKMTKVIDIHIDADSNINYVDLKSTRNLLLWHEARTYLVDQIMQPTSFLRAVFDPTCAIMALIAVTTTLFLSAKHILRDDPFEEFSSLLMMNLIVSYLFFYVVISFTRLIQRALREHEGLIVKGKLNVLNELLQVEKDVESKRKSVDSTPVRIMREAEEVCKEVLGPSFVIPALGERDKWRTATIKLGDLLRRGDKAKAARLEEALRLLEPICYQRTVSMSSWKAEGDNTMHMGPCYLVPPCGQTTIKRVRRIHLDPTEDTNRRHAEYYRRLRIIESIVTHISYSYVRPKILGMTLTHLLHLSILTLIGFTTALMVRVVTSGDYFSD